jgi:hypothetical protein
MIGQTQLSEPLATGDEMRSLVGISYGSDGLLRIYAPTRGIYAHQKSNATPRMTRSLELKNDYRMDWSPVNVRFTAHPSVAP